MSEVLPPDLYPGILSRVFVESLLRFRCVCKAWHQIIDDPAFIKLHLHRQSDSGQLILSKDGRDTEQYTLSLDSLNCYSSKTPSRKDDFASPLKTWISHDVPSHDVPRISTFLLATCNGLILMSSHIKNWTALWNPFTRETHVLPSYTSIVFSNQWVVGSSRIAFGYDFVTDDYKVVKLVELYNKTLHGYYNHSFHQTLVYSLKSNSWRRVKDCPYFPLLGVPGVFLNGAVHWISLMTDVEDKLILAFDLGIEDYNFLPLPSILSNERCRYSPAPILSALSECLLVTWYDSVYCLDDYGGKNSWTKLFSFVDLGMVLSRPIAYFKSKGEVLLSDDYKAYIYFLVNIEKKSAKKVTIYGIQGGWYSYICLASLVRLKKKSAKKVTVYGGVQGCRYSRTCLASFDRLKKKSRRGEKSPKDRLKLTITTADVLEDQRC